MPALVVGLVASACGGAGGAAGPSGSSGTPGAPGRTVTIARSDAGHTVSLRVGDRLVVDLGTGPQASWTLASYPAAQLSVSSQSPSEGRFEFTARSPGTGTILLVMKGDCGPEQTVPCAQPGQDEPVDAVGGMLAPKPFEVTVVVA